MALQYLRRSFFVEFADRASPQVVVMVENPDLCGQAILLKRRAQVIPDESDLIFLRPRAGRHSCILVGVHFVLHRDRLHRHALRGIGLQELHKILRVRTEVARPHRTAQHRASSLHPSRRTPRRRKDKQVGIRFPRQPQHRQHIGLVVRDGESLHLGIGIAFVIAEDFSRVIAGPDAGAANAEPHFRGMKQFMKQLLASRSGKLIEHVAGGVGESRAESEHLLVLLAGIEHYGVRVLRRLGGSAPG